MRNTVYAIPVLAILSLAGCSKSEPPAPQTTTGQDSHPVKNVESLPSGTIQERARTMNRASDLGKSLEQQSQERAKDMDAQGK